jgi:hypothetical protein
MELGGLRQLVFTAEGLREQWDFIVGDRMDNKSQDYKEKAYRVLEDIFDFVEKTRATEYLGNEDATGFVNAAFLIFLRSGCTEPEIVYEVFRVIAAVEHLSDDQLDDYPEFIDHFSLAYCNMKETLNRHPSYQEKKVLVN